MLTEASYKEKKQKAASIDKYDLPAWIEFYSEIKNISDKCRVSGYAVYYESHIIAIARYGPEFLDDFNMPYFDFIENENTTSILVKEKQKEFLSYMLEDLKYQEGKIGIILKRKIKENCPYCYNEVYLNNEFSVQSCPNCNKLIKTCSICIPAREKVPDCCRYCPLEKEG